MENGGGETFTSSRTREDERYNYPFTKKGVGEDIYIYAYISSPSPVAPDRKWPAFNDSLRLLVAVSSSPRKGISGLSSPMNHLIASG